MRIGFDGKRLFNNFTGLGNYSRTLVNNLIRYAPEQQVDLYTTHISDQMDIGPYRQNPKICIHEHPGAFKSLWRTFGLKNSLLRDGLDVYHGLSNELPVGIQKTGIPSVVTIHDLIFRRLPHTYPAIDRKMYDWKVRHACREAGLVLAVSACTKADIIHYYGTDPAKIKVLYQACDPVFYSEPDESHEKSLRESLGLPENYLLYVGSITQRKNLIVAIEALSKIPVEKQLPLVVVGRGKGYQTKAHTRAMQLGVARRIIWLPNISIPSDLRALYSGAAIMLHPSRYEGFGIPIVEALLSKVPVIATHTPAAKEAGGPETMYLDPDKPADWAGAIQELLMDEAKRSAQRDGGYAYAMEHFDGQRLTAQLLEHYQSLL